MGFLCGLAACEQLDATVQANGHSCIGRIAYLRQGTGLSQIDACARVAHEFRDECGDCDPRLLNSSLQASPINWSQYTDVIRATVPRLPSESRASDVIDEDEQNSIAALLQQMSLREKAGQMLQLDHRTKGLEAIINGEADGSAGVGSVLYSGTLQMNTAELARRSAQFQRASQRHRLGIPLLIGIDAVHGNALVTNATVFPHNVGLGCTRNVSLAAAIGAATAREAALGGVNWAFAPCLASPQNQRWGRTYEGFSSSPELTGELGAAFVRGLQAPPHGVLACAKHFAADGATVDGIDQGDAELTASELAAQLAPYAVAVSAGVQTVMVSYSSVHQRKCHANGDLITEFLKKHLGFTGLVVSDWGAADELPGSAITRFATAINAGVDMIMLPGTWTMGGRQSVPWPMFLDVVLRAVDFGLVSKARIDDAVRRILKAKIAAKLLQVVPKEQRGQRQMPTTAFSLFAEGVEKSSLHGESQTQREDPLRASGLIAICSTGRVKLRRNSTSTGANNTRFDNLRAEGEADEREIDLEIEPEIDEEIGRVVGSLNHSDLARSAVRQSLVLLSVNDDVLPFSRNGSVLVACSGADNLGLLMGGWSLAWQGTSSSDADGARGSTVLRGLQRQSGCQSCIHHSPTGEAAAGEHVSVAVAVVTEAPYAEGFGDAERSPVPLSEADAACISRLHERDPALPIVLVTVSGRAMDVAKYVNGASGVAAVVASWLPGSEGGDGIAEVLYGSAPFTGKLSMPWGTEFGLGDGLWTAASPPQPPALPPPPSPSPPPPVAPLPPARPPLSPMPTAGDSKSMYALFSVSALALVLVSACVCRLRLAMHFRRQKAGNRALSLSDPEQAVPPTTRRRDAKAELSESPEKDVDSSDEDSKGSGIGSSASKRKYALRRNAKSCFGSEDASRSLMHESLTMDEAGGDFDPREAPSSRPSGGESASKHRASARGCQPCHTIGGLSNAMDDESDVGFKSRVVKLAESKDLLSGQRSRSARKAQSKRVSAEHKASGGENGRSVGQKGPSVDAQRRREGATQNAPKKSSQRSKLASPQYEMDTM